MVPCIGTVTEPVAAARGGFHGLPHLPGGNVVQLEFLPAATGAFEQFAQPLHPFAVCVGVALAQEAVHGRLEVAVLHEVVGQESQELLDVGLVVVFVAEAAIAVANGH